MLRLVKDKIAAAIEKNTSPIHVLCGFVTVLSGVFIKAWLGPSLILIFLIIQIWTEKEWESSQHDFWEYVAGIFSCCGILLILKLVLFLSGTI